jgi:hypothetical protein
MTNSNDVQIQPFYPFAHRATQIFMILLATVFIGTCGQAVWQLSQPSTRITGAIVEVSETMTSRQSARYELILRTDEGQLVRVRLRNSGHILNSLMEQDQAGIEGRRVVVETRRGIAEELFAQDGGAGVIRESGIQPVIQLLIGLLALFILILLLWPNLVAGRLG